MSKKIFYNLCFCAFALLFSLGIWTELTLQPDSESYLIFADEIASLELFEIKEASWATAIRTPAYPALIALSKLFLGDTSLAVLTLHFICAFAALSFFVIRFSPLISSQAAIFLGFMSLFVWREYYSFVLTEWVALCGLLVFFCLLPLKLEELTGRRFLLISLFVSFLILLKPVFFSLVPVLAGLILIMVPKENLRAAFTVILSGMLPVFLWAVFNLYRLNSFTVAAFVGHNIFGNATLAGFADPEQSDLRLSRFADFVNRNKTPPAGQEQQFLEETLSQYQSLSSYYNHNVYKVALSFESDQLHSRVEYDRLMRDYALQAILENPRSYLMLFASGLAVAKHDLWLMLVSIISLFMMIKSGHQMSIVLGVALATHITNLILVSFLQINIERFYMLTLIPLGVFTVAGLLSALGMNKLNRIT